METPPMTTLKKPCSRSLPLFIYRTEVSDGRGERSGLLMTNTVLLLRLIHGPRGDRRLPQSQKPYDHHLTATNSGR